MKNDSFTSKDCILIGLFISISFLSKFTLSGYYLGVGICLIIITNLHSGPETH